MRSARVSQPGTASGPPQFASISAEAHGDLLRARTELLNLYRAIERLAELTNINTRFKLDLPDARSTSPLGLDMTHTAAALDSADEINASPTSFSPFGPEWPPVSSTAELTIGGEYDPAGPNGTYTFQSRRDGTRGVTNIRIRVTDPLGNRNNYVVGRNDPLNQQYNIGNGLYFTLGAGSMVNRDTTTIDVFNNVGSVVNPDLPLGGIRNQNPNLQFGSPDIVDGSFDLNGENISVLTTDTLNDVVQRINQSSAGVTAVFNALTERIEFVQDTLGSAATIDLTNDGSNFLAATKLGNLNVVAGIDPETVQNLEDVATFSTVQSGDILINSQQIAIDIENDSLSTVLDKINNSGAGVVASFDSVAQQVLIEANESASVLNIDGNGTGLFAALNLPEGRVDPEAVSRGISRRRSYEIADAANAVFEKLNNLFADSTFVGGGNNSGAFRAPLEAAFRTAFDGADAGNILGVAFDASTNARLRGDFASIDRRDFTANLQRRGNLVRDFLAGNDDQGGLVKGLLVASQQALTAVNQSLGLSGTFVDTYA
ncbi:MAG: flagellin hook IN motif-containing protein [Woeseiaceae bacterium]